MSTRFPHRIVRNALIWQVVVLLAPALVYAGTPQTPRTANRPAVRNRTTPPKPAPSTPRPVLRPASFTPEMPLSEAIDILRNCTTPPLNIIVLWRDLDSVGIYRDTAIGLDSLSGLRLSQCLDMLTLSLSAGMDEKIGYTVHGGAITIATTKALPVSRQTTRVYDVSDLVAPPARYSFPSMGFGGMGYGGMYGNQMTGLSGGYGGGLGSGYGMGSSMPGGFSGMGGNAYGMGMMGMGMGMR